VATARGTGPGHAGSLGSIRNRMVERAHQTAPALHELLGLFDPPWPATKIAPLLFLFLRLLCVIVRELGHESHNQQEQKSDEYSGQHEHARHGSMVLLPGYYSHFSLIGAPLAAGCWLGGNTLPVKYSNSSISTPRTMATAVTCPATAHTSSLLFASTKPITPLVQPAAGLGVPRHAPPRHRAATARMHSTQASVAACSTANLYACILV
jgi:hypothetical protein